MAENYRTRCSRQKTEGPVIQWSKWMEAGRYHRSLFLEQLCHYQEYCQLCTWQQQCNSAFVRRPLAQMLPWKSTYCTFPRDGRQRSTACICWWWLPGRGFWGPCRTCFHVTGAPNHDSKYPHRIQGSRHFWKLSSKTLWLHCVAREDDDVPLADSANMQSRKLTAQTPKNVTGGVGVVPHSSEASQAGILEVGLLVVPALCHDNLWKELVLLKGWQGAKIQQIGAGRREATSESAPWESVDHWGGEIPVSFSMADP